LSINSPTHKQSVSQTLHTSTASIFTPLLDYHLSTSSNINTNTTYTLIRRSLTALIHHVKNAEQFESLGDLIVQKFLKQLKSTDMSSESDVERLRKMIEVMGVVCSVRRGSRLNGMLFVNNVDGFDYSLPI
jgi:U3 small nucleolar RNA-associated protein 20